MGASASFLRAADVTRPLERPIVVLDAADDAAWRIGEGFKG